MNCQDDLSRILERVSAIEDAATREARPLDSHELSELTRLALEAKQVLNSELGVFNDFSQTIQSTISRTQLTAFGKPALRELVWVNSARITAQGAGK
jgi:hypothetical protein